jgi:catechol 2,3-dioxygenase-like lactoylglutathione lyase family enzyme
VSERRLISHIDLRVREPERGLAFYDALLGAFGFERVTTPPFGPDEPTWRRPHWRANDEFFGFVVDPELVPNANRLAFQAYSPEEVDRATAAARRAGARDVDGPTDYGGYYASFFEDPDGNRLEICFLTKHQGLVGGS